MKNRTFSARAYVTPRGELSYFGGELKQFLQQNPDTYAVITLDVFAKASSHAFRGRYMKVIVPQFQQAFYEHGERLTLKDTDERIRSMCPVCIREIGDIKTGEFIPELKPLKEMTSAEMVEMFETLYQIGAEEFSICIDN